MREGAPHSAIISLREETRGGSQMRVFRRLPGMPKYIYSEKESLELEEYVTKTFGEFKYAIHELISLDIHADILVVEPTEEEPFYKLVTYGAGAYKMPVPKEYREYASQYAEYVINIPKDWDIKSSAPEDYWPIRVLKEVSRIPVICRTWLGPGHTTQSDEQGSPYAPDTKLNSVVLDYAMDKEENRASLQMSSGKKIDFYQVIPLYPEELKFKMDNNADKILDKLDEELDDYRLISKDRKNVCL